MVDGSFAATQFYADVEGHPKQRALELALEELEFVSQPKSLKILGFIRNTGSARLSNRLPNERDAMPGAALGFHELSFQVR